MVLTVFSGSKIAELCQNWEGNFDVLVLDLFYGTSISCQVNLMLIKPDLLLS